MSKAGKGDGVDAGAVGSQHPVPENIPHLSSPIQNTSANSPSGSGSVGSLGGSSGSLPKNAHHGSIPGIQAGSPIKESSFLNRETSIDDEQDSDKADSKTQSLGGGEGLPIRR